MQGKDKKRLIVTLLLTDRVLSSCARRYTEVKACFAYAWLAHHRSQVDGANCYWLQSVLALSKILRATTIIPSAVPVDITIITTAVPSHITVVTSTIVINFISPVGYVALRVSSNPLTAYASPP